MLIEDESTLVVCYITKWGLENEIEVEVVHLKPNIKND
jgi:hypothetical protein